LDSSTDDEFSNVRNVRKQLSTDVNLLQRQKINNLKVGIMGNSDDVIGVNDDLSFTN